jgi:hypothetical protein
MKLHAVRPYFIRHHNLLHHSKDSLQARFIPSSFSGHPKASIVHEESLSPASDGGVTPE